jgi:hypothetical protein
MEEGDRFATRSPDAVRAWMQAACAVHEQERRLRHFIAEMNKLADGLVARMMLAGHGRARDGVLAYAIQLRECLAAEVHNAPRLEQWRATVDERTRAQGEIDPQRHEDFAREMEAPRPPDEPALELPLR